MMWQARVKGRSMGRQRLQVCSIQDDDKIEWKDLDLPLLQRLLDECNGQELQLQMLRERCDELLASSACQAEQIARLQERIGQLKAASAALNMPRPVMEVQPLVVKGGHQAGASAVSELVTRISNSAKIVPGTIMVGPNIAPPGGYERVTYVVGEGELKTGLPEPRVIHISAPSLDSHVSKEFVEGSKKGARIVAWDEPGLDPVGGYEIGLMPPFGGFPFSPPMEIGA